MGKDILIHTCCADCFLNATAYLLEKNVIDINTNVVSYFYNPNIHPRSEYQARLAALKKTISTLEKMYIKLVVPDYKPSIYMDLVKENLNSRCKICWELRLEQSFKYAAENNIRDITSTMLTSNYLNREAILEIANELKNEHKINFIELDNQCNCLHHGFYKQNYCGCCFSLTEKMICK